MRNNTGNTSSENDKSASDAREQVAIDPQERDKRKNLIEIDLESPREAPKCHVLVVEDDPIILDLLQDVVTSAGFKVLIAKNGPDGLALFENYVDSTICVILDYGIPGMHASRLLERMQEIDTDVKVILSSGYPQNFIHEDFPVEKLAGFMAKPYDPQVLISELKRLTK